LAGRGKPRQEWGRGVRPTWPRVAVLGVLLVLCFVVAKTCQQSQIRFSQGEAIGIAKREVDFKPKLTQIRLLRQGLNRKPFWFVSLSIPVGRPDEPDRFRRLTLVKVDANTGDVDSVDNQIPGQTGKRSTRQ
jgi:hypothetical protein